MLAPRFESEGRPLLAALEAGLRVHPSLFRLTIGRSEQVVVCHPEAAYQVLVAQARQFSKAPAAGATPGLKTLLGEGILTTADVATWRTGRRVLHPHLSRRSLVHLSAAIGLAAERLFERWRLPAGTVDVCQGALDLVAEVLHRWVFGVDHEEAERLELEVSLALALQRPKQIRAARRLLLARLRALLVERRREHRAGYARTPNLLDGLMASGLPDEQLCDQLLTMMAAGHDTTAAALAWCLHALAAEPARVEAVVGELNATVGDRPLAPADLSDLPQLQACLKEALRLYPPIPAAPRTARLDSVVAGFAIPAGTRVLVSIYAIHRHPDVWPQPNVFDPTRFLGAADRRRGAYLPYGAGARSCAGRHLADLILGQVVAETVRRFRLQPGPHQAQPRLGIGLVPSGGLPLLLAPR